MESNQIISSPAVVKYAQLKCIKISLVSSPCSFLCVPVRLLHLEMQFWEHQYFTGPNGPGTFIPDYLKRKIKFSHNHICLRKPLLKICLSIRCNQTEQIFLSRWERQHTLLEAGILKPFGNPSPLSSWWCLLASKSQPFSRNFINYDTDFKPICFQCQIFNTLLLTFLCIPVEGGRDSSKKYLRF